MRSPLYISTPKIPLKQEHIFIHLKKEKQVEQQVPTDEQSGNTTPIEIPKGKKKENTKIK